MGSTRKIVVIVEDEVDIATFLSRIVESRGFDSRIAYNAQQAIDMIALYSDRLYLVILDIFLPQGNGIDIARRILSDYPHVRLVISTASTDYANYKELMSLGVRLFLRKPYEISDLDGVLRDDA